MMPSLAGLLGLLSLLAIPLSMIVLSHRGGSGGAPGRGRARPIPRVVWWVTGLLIGAAVYLLKPQLDGAGTGHAFWAFFLFMMGMAGLLMLLFLLASVRPRHQRIARAMGLARAGQVDAAVADLR